MLPPPIDPMSDSFVWFGGSKLDYDEAKSLLERLAVPTTEGSFSKPRKFSSFNEVELQEFVGILVPGGHAPLIDLYKVPLCPLSFYSLFSPPPLLLTSLFPPSSLPLPLVLLLLLLLLPLPLLLIIILLPL
jgi:hypothetical protein